MNLDSPLLDLDGQPFQDKATLKTVILGVLLAQLPGDEKLGAPQKLSMFELSMKVHDKASYCPLTAEDISLIKDRVGRAFPPLVVGRVFQSIDPAAVAS